ncbi:uncharacterized protein I206_104828 [Kwoniella pini CBS 10737]|uniref:Calpain catalytic domain-containing protein n=1 Tax=Kwoniella pini CBS 10737 TaxID=1296096 RepID=A0A1B9I7U1_9TREE|nr:uncharacterized protein I206_02367 [Kwoniella pini CBS 10737]OCF51652.1 hypothetical protein I206_02367 [Kwoniella pini CBS 10737]
MFLGTTTFVICTLASTILAGPIAKPVGILPGQEEASKDLIAEPLWSKDGPVLTDILQGPDGECWFQAGLISLVKCNQHAITNIVKDTGIGKGENGADTDKAEVKLYTKDYELKVFEVKHQSSIGGTVGELPTWWPAAMKRAAMKMGGYKGLHENSIGAGFPSDALKMLTGKKTMILDSGSFDKVQIWSWIQHSNDTPMIITTKSKTSKLVKGHAYVIMSYGGDGPENATLRLRNPWEGITWHDLDEIYKDISQISTLDEFRSIP